MSKNSAVDDYIASKATFSQEILIHLRQIIHDASPDIIETIKWRQPCFEHNGLICAFAAFKKHVNFSFFKGQFLNDSAGIFVPSDNNELTALKFSSISDIPESEVLKGYIQQAIALNSNDEFKKNVAPRKDKSDLVIPDDFAHALTITPAAKRVFSEFSYSKQKDYIEWITSAKREATRATRLATAVEWISEGKGRNWKYENC
ncbi:YdeI/OmpD-associated family protein [Colwellia sp. BRX10-3]|uniref:DUF1801 domain-containing protein n=1 Tax=Colwellia sp. BRX10-3 TaxID=2759844 RepID=UPI0015F60872|nr:DUF1801 domain-containing protein [Colwellia sp. BRX10-3]MBA6389530.1 YdeI/OmpD-associated family protein [Colwellia sp. BRX10-3]